MALSTQDGLLAWRNIINRCFGTKPFVRFTLLALRQWLAQHGGNPDLQVVGFASLTATETVIADVACKLYALVTVKAATATATFNKLTDSATTASAASSELRFWSNAASQVQVFTWPTGLSFANGIVAVGTTTANGSGSSGTDACSGFAVIGAA